jgi:hypothetical protein
MGRFNQPLNKAGKQPIPSTYDPSLDAGTSATDTSDLNPGRAYDIDFRRLDNNERAISKITDNENQQNRINKFMAAAKSAGKFKQNALINEPTSANHGETFSPIGSIGYARKPKLNFGLPFI